MGHWDGVGLWIRICSFSLFQTESYQLINSRSNRIVKLRTKDVFAFESWFQEGWASSSTLFPFPDVMLMNERRPRKTRNGNSHEGERVLASMWKVEVQTGRTSAFSQVATHLNRGMWIIYTTHSTLSRTLSLVRLTTTLAGPRVLAKLDVVSIDGLMSEVRLILSMQAKTTLA